jgi:signal transduction histidine kinase
MPLGLKTKQVAGVTALVTLTVVLLSAWYLSALVHTQLEDTRARAELIANIIFQRARAVAQPGEDPYVALKADSGVLNILQGAQAYEKEVVYAAIVDPGGMVVADGDESAIGKKLPPADGLDAFLRAGAIAQARALLDAGGRTYDVSVPLVSGTEVGTIHVGISTLLIRAAFERSLQTPLLTALAAIAGAGLVAMLLAQLVLRPIHVIRTGLARLGRGEIDVAVDLPHEGELGDLGESFKAVSARLAADRTEQATIASVVEHLEDAVALIGPDGTVIFANPTMQTMLGERAAIRDLAATHPYRTTVEDTLRDHEARGPLAVEVPGAGERLVLTNVVDNADGRPMGVLLVARNLAYLTHVESTLRYYDKLAALGRLSAGIAHEIKNPLNAMMIHLELLRLKLKEHPASEHLAIITAQMRRLDEVVQGFLRFTRPADLRLEPVALPALFDAILPIVRAEADKQHIDIRVECPPDLPRINADAALVEQACLNLALNACQAMPNGGRLRLAGAARPGRVEITVEDTGVGIPPEQLGRIFDLYFTTKENGSGIGLSMVYRTAQLHDGDIEVASVPGRGTTFRLTLPQAESAAGTRVS